MRLRLLLAPALWLCCGAAPAQAAVSGQSLDEAARAVAPRVVEGRRDLHQNPELGNREFRTSKLVAAHLKSLGLEVRTGIAHTGVVGILKGGRPGPTIALRADMDALPVTERVDVPFKSTVTAEYRARGSKGPRNPSATGVVFLASHSICQANRGSSAAGIAW